MRNRWALLFALLFFVGGEATAQTPDPDPYSKSVAEFTLTTCLAAMNDPAKVELMARENNWTNKTAPVSAAMSKIMKSESSWEVMQGEKKFTLIIWAHASGPPLKECALSFLGTNVKRDDFFNSIAASAELTFVVDSRFPQRRSESYEIKSDLPNKLMLTIMSRSDGTVFSAMVSERTPQRPVPSAEPQ
jgi:hypothetical protein